MRFSPRRLHEFRLSRGLTLKRLARKLGVQEVTLQRWERGKHLPSPIHRFRLRVMLAKKPWEKVNFKLVTELT